MSPAQSFLEGQIMIRKMEDPYNETHEVHAMVNYVDFLFTSISQNLMRHSRVHRYILPRRNEKILNFFHSFKNYIQSVPPIRMREYP